MIKELQLGGSEGKKRVEKNTLSRVRKERGRGKKC